MSGRRPTAAALRRALRLAFGLALEGLSDEQVLAAAGAALDGSHPALAPAGRLAQVVDRLPIDESWMFRDEPLWAWLRADLLPALLAAALERGRPLRAVSLGCAGGQETHSLAILALRLLLDMGVPSSGAAAHVRLRGVDASPGRVALAASGLASAWSVQRCPPGWLGERVRCEDPAAGRWRVDAAVRSLCRFEVGNLLDAAAPGSQALRGEDLVLCRHVLIYFRPEEAATAVVGLAAALDPGAVLVLSPAESHFAAGLPGLEPLGMVGAFRARPVAVAEPAVPRRDAPSARRPRAPRAEAGRPSRPAAPRRAERPAETASRLARAAVEHAAAGRPADALREARAACFHDPRHLFSRLVLGRELMAVDRYRGRAVLAELLDLAVTLPAEAEVPHAPGLSVGQLTTAARLLMQRGEP